MYDALSVDYDRFVNWQGRLAIELPFIIEKLGETQARLVLDAATGTGMHAIALAQCGFVASGADLSKGMIERARVNSSSAGIQVRFETAGFGKLAKMFGKHTFDAVLCLGNSLPHLLSLPEVSAALADFATCLRKGGLLLIQNRNFDVVMAQHERWMEPQSHSDGNTEWVFQRFYDFDPDGLLTFNMVTLIKTGQVGWTQSVSSSRLRPLLKDELVASLEVVGFTEIQSYGSMAGVAFESESSPNLVVIARSSK